VIFTAASLLRLNHQFRRSIFHRIKIVIAGQEGSQQVPVASADYPGVAWYALDPANAERLWETALGPLSVQVPT
jgi:hypothetical protein